VWEDVVLFEARNFADIAPLAWLVDCCPGIRRPILYHGRHVELFDTGFFEGAWAGDFGQADFAQSVEVFGSGAKLDSSTITFVPPSHTYEPLVLFTGRGRIAVSNSLAFLGAFCDFDLDPIDWRSGERFAAITLGLGQAVQSLQLRTGTLHVRYHHNFVVADGAVRRTIAKPFPQRFEDFSSYYGYLLRNTREVCDNAQHHARVTRYEPLTTLSSGYDSAATAAIAARLGCREAVSLTRSQRGELESGGEIAKALGLQLREFERVDRVAQTGPSLAEFLTPGAQGEDYVYHVFQHLVPEKVLFTGFGAGNVWDKDTPPTEDLSRKDLSGSSFGEFRITRDFIHLPLPSIGCLRRADIHRISHSDEMACYSRGGNYDKPIARRILESGGVPHDAFGQRKHAASLIFYRRTALFSKTALIEIAALKKALHLSWRERVSATLLHIRWQVGLALFHCFRRLTLLRGSRIPLVKALRPIGRAGIAALSYVLGPYKVFEHGDPRNAILHRWALSSIKSRYAAASPLAMLSDSIRHRLHVIVYTGYTILAAFV
jgi:hypothetical protein